MMEITPEELKTFIKESMEARHSPNRRVLLGTLDEDAQERIKTICGKKPGEVDIDSEAVRHILKKAAHNLEADDLLLALEVINTSTDISLSDRKHRDNSVLTFRKNIDGDIVFLTEVRAKNGFLLVFNAWRQKKARSRRGSNAGRSLQGTHVQNEPTRNEPDV